MIPSKLQGILLEGITRQHISSRLQQHLYGGGAHNSLRSPMQGCLPKLVLVMHVGILLKKKFQRGDASIWIRVVLCCNHQWRHALRAQSPGERCSSLLINFNPSGKQLLEDCCIRFQCGKMWGTPSTRPCVLSMPERKSLQPFLNFGHLRCLAARALAQIRLQRTQETPLQQLAWATLLPLQQLGLHKMAHQLLYNLAVALNSEAPCARHSMNPIEWVLLLKERAVDNQMHACFGHRKSPGSLLQPTPTAR
mmetsp:Transcript_70355/g.177884  ORF Transcript_70355/g.177884 Transcript_70355/m.177884 type:complete len:251 (-) Transcript_70355:221-973(-)